MPRKRPLLKISTPEGQSDSAEKPRGSVSNASRSSARSTCSCLKRDMLAPPPTQHLALGSGRMATATAAAPPSHPLPECTREGRGWQQRLGLALINASIRNKCPENLLSTLATGETPCLPNRPLRRAP